MKRFKLSPPYLLLSLLAIGLTTVVSLQVILYIQQSLYAKEAYAPLPEKRLVLPTATTTAQLTTQTQTTVAIVPSATIQEADNVLRLAYIQRGMNCSFITEIAATILKEKLKVEVDTISFDTDEALFMALAEEQVDLSLCIIDPNDRGLIRNQLGYISQIGSHYWSDDNSKLQIWANSSSKAKLREQDACILRFFEDLSLNEIVFQGISAEMWIQTHEENEVQTWLTCLSERSQE